ncbi:MAG: TRAP transporter permease [Proteobacteria bacterium]|nr:TRAP transporter permease [Pseudomonadota bacterium]MBU2227049.1 TRAP transporter permease [Pseudomonadota bacterium]MBU2261212.1 TRAP transporter permease [Pseudomonadota bacterium]
MSFERILKTSLLVLAVGMSSYHLVVAYIGPPEAFFFRGTHLLLALVLTFLIHPRFGRRGAEQPSLFDYLLVALSLVTIGYLWLNVGYIYDRFVFVDDLRTTDLVFGAIFIVLVLEATRRVIGLALPITALCFVAYALFIAKVRPESVIEINYLTSEGIFGIPLNVSATYVILFILFGAFVERSGTGKLFMDFALSITGHAVGGPAKVAVITSGMFGTISGSAVANVMTTGTFTIPMMMRLGYRPAFAGAVEAVASTGGQILPPIMGAAAFVMAEFLGISYISVAGYALLPALLYYVAVYAAVHFEAKRTGMVGLPREDLPKLSAVLKERGHLFIPLFIIIGVLIAGYSAPYAALLGIASVVPVAMMRKSTRPEITIKMLISALEAGALNTLAIAMACACAGIVIGAIAQTGLGLSFTGLVLTVAQDHLISALILTMTAGIFLGMGLPTTPAYIIQVALLVPALIKLGIVPAAAHLFVFYFAILSAITPPVALAVYAATGISRSELWQTGWAAVKLGATGYIVPFMFVFSPSLLMIGSWARVGLAIVTALLGVTCLAGSLHKYYLTHMAHWERVVLFVAALALIKPGWLTDIVGLSLFAIVLATQWRKSRSKTYRPVTA